MNFYIYIVFGSKFRRELKRFFIKCKINVRHCFRQENFYENDYSNNQNNSSNFEQCQLMDKNPPYSTLTTNGFAFGYKWNKTKSLYS